MNLPQHQEDPQDTAPEPTAESLGHRKLLIGITVVLAVVPLTLATLRLLGWI